MPGAKHFGGIPDTSALVELKTAKLPEEHSRWTLERHKVINIHFLLALCSTSSIHDFTFTQSLMDVSDACLVDTIFFGRGAKSASGLA